MKRFILTAAALLALCTGVLAQNSTAESVYNTYTGKPGFTTMSIPGSLIKSMAKGAMGSLGDMPMDMGSARSIKVVLVDVNSATRENVTEFGAAVRNMAKDPQYYQWMEINDNLNQKTTVYSKKRDDSKEYLYDPVITIESKGYIILMYYIEGKLGVKEIEFKTSGSVIRNAGDPAGSVDLSAIR